MRAPNRVKVREWIEVEIPGASWLPSQTLEQACRELSGFFSEHEEWKSTRAFTNAEYEDRCPHCDEPWEPDYTRKLKPCGYCGKSLL